MTTEKQQKRHLQFNILTSFGVFVIGGLLTWFGNRLVVQVDNGFEENKIEHKQIRTEYEKGIKDVINQLNDEQKLIKNDINVIKSVISDVHPEHASRFFESTTKGNGISLDVEKLINGDRHSIKSITK